MFIATQLKYEKLDISNYDTTVLWSSFRNAYWRNITTDEEETNRFIDSLLEAAIECIIQDSTDMTIRRESGWSFLLINECHVRFIDLLPEAALAVGTRDSLPLRIKTCLKAALNRNVLTRHDLSVDYTGKLCFPFSIISSLERRLSLGRSAKAPNRYRFRKEMIKDRMSLLNFSTLITDRGMPVNLFSKFEDMNFPFSRELLTQYPFLRGYDSLSINLYRIDHNARTDSYHLNPVALSKNCLKNKAFHIDLLLVTPSILSQPTYRRIENHVVLITNTTRLIVHFKRVHMSMTTRCSLAYYHCPKCLKIFTKYPERERHVADCSAFGKGERFVHNRRNKNTLLHRPFRYNKYTCKTERSYLNFPTHHAYKKIANIAFGCLDFEATNEKWNDESGERAPSNTVFIQRPFAYSLVFASTYEDIQLPPELAYPRTAFIGDPDIDSEQLLYKNLLCSIRTDAFSIDRFRHRVLSSDRGPPDVGQLSLYQKLEYMLKRHCDVCGRMFGSLATNKAGRRYRVIKTKDHDHYYHFRTANQFSNESVACPIRAILCQGCNLAAASDKLASKFPLVIEILNACAYDFSFVLKAVTSFTDSTFRQRSSSGNDIVTKFFSSKPRILFKDVNTPLSISVKFSCHRKASCERCSLTNDAIDHLRVTHQKIPACPADRFIVFRDSLKMVTSSLDGMIHDVHSVAEKKGFSQAALFSATWRYMQSKGYEYSSFLYMIQQKLKLPFEMINGDEQYLLRTEPPPIEDFYSKLRDGNITQEEYQTFLKVWELLNVDNLKNLITIYVELDSLLLR